VDIENTDDAILKCKLGRRVWGKSWCKVPDQVDRTRSSQLQSFHNQIRRVVLWHPHHGDCHLRSAALSRYDMMWHVRLLCYSVTVMTLTGWCEHDHSNGYDDDNVNSMIVVDVIVTVINHKQCDQCWK